MDEICPYGGGQYGESEPPYGECLEPAPVLETTVITYAFVIELESDDTEEDAREKSIYLETNIGAIRLTYNSLARRRIEDLAIAKTKSTGYAKQFELIANHLENFGVDRDAAKLKLFKPRK